MFKFTSTFFPSNPTGFAEQLALQVCSSLICHDENEDDEDDEDDEDEEDDEDDEDEDSEDDD